MEPKEASRKHHQFHDYTQWHAPHTYSIDEAADMPGIMPETLLSYIAANELPTEPLGNGYRIAADDLEDFLLTRSQGIVLRRERRCISV